MSGSWIFTWKTCFIYGVDLRSNNREIISLKTFRFIPISELMHSINKEECYRRIISITQSLTEIYTFNVSIIIKTAIKITNVLDDLLIYLFLEIIFVLCLCKNHVWYLFGVWNRSVKKVRARDRNK